MPVFKKGDAGSVENYRPITLTSALSKLLEYAMLERINSFIKKNDILESNQHGFRPGFSTHSALHTFLGNVFDVIGAGECPVGIFCDLSRAFDCVDHGILLDKLAGYGMRGIVNKWIGSYLEGRRQYVQVVQESTGGGPEACSTLRDVPFGVPQGSVLGPVLFLLYINDLVQSIPEEVLVMYADDTSVLISDKNKDNLNIKCTTTIKNMCDWFVRNKLHFNAQKTNCLTFHNRQKTVESTDIQGDNVVINSGKSVKFLGVHLQDTLQWNEHCTALVSTLSKACYQMKYLNSILCLEQLRCFYFAEVHSRLMYGVCFWGCPGTNSNNVFTIQKRIIRNMNGKPTRYPSKELFKSNDILPLPCIFILEVLLQTFKQKNLLIRIRMFTVITPGKKIIFTCHCLTVK